MLVLRVVGKFLRLILLDKQASVHIDYPRTLKYSPASTRLPSWLVFADDFNQSEQLNFNVTVRQCIEYLCDTDTIGWW